MFAAGRVANAAAAGSSRQRQPQENADASWLQVGQSFRSQDDDHRSAVSDERALVKVRRTKENKSKKKKKDDRKKKKTKKKAKDRKRRDSDRHKRRRRSEYSSSSSSSSCSESDSDADERSRRRHKKRKRRHSDEEKTWELVEEPRDAIERYAPSTGAAAADALYEFDCVGDRENESMGAYNPPVYRLDTYTLIGSGHRIPRSFSGKNILGEQQRKDDPSAVRYFGTAARRAERQLASSSRLRLAYSERRLRRPRNADDSAELAFIPVDPVVEGELRGVPEKDAENEDESSEDEPTSEIILQTDLENVQQFLVRETRRLHERLAAAPTDVDAWLDLLAFQEQSQRLHLSSRDAGSSSVVQEKQLAVLTKALEKNPTSELLQRVRLNMILQRDDSGSKSSSLDKYRQEIERQLETAPRDVDLWRRLVEHVQRSSFGTFTMTMLRDVYARVLTVLSGELASLVTEDSARGTNAKTSSIQVFSGSSLLGPQDPYAVDQLGVEASTLTLEMLRIHEMLTLAECKAGFVERAVVQLQALYAFNDDSTVKHDTNASLLQRRQSFAAAGDYARLGEREPSDDTALVKYSPPNDSFVAWVDATSTSFTASLNPPASIRATGHQASLGASVSDEMKETEKPSQRDEQVGRKSGQWVYSNLHGYRIWVEDADDTQEYERILSELRDSETAKERAEAAQRRRLRRDALAQSRNNRLKDERVDFVDVPRDDNFVSWLMSELHADATQWTPLQPSHPAHQALIEAQPDRAILAEEVLPYLFRVPPSLQFEIVLSLLRVLGVQVGPRMDAYADHPQDVQWLAEPIERALDSTATSSIALSLQEKHALLENALHSDEIVVSPETVRDPSRVQFIRNVLRSHLEREKIASTQRLLKLVWIKFESQVVQHAADDPKRAMDACREWSQSLLLPTETQPVDAVLLAAYVQLELAVGNRRHAKRSCEKALQALAVDVDKSSSRSVHRLISLRLRLERTHNKTKDDRERRLYMLWWALQPRSRESPDALEKRLGRDAIKTQLSTVNGADIVAAYRIQLELATAECVCMRRRRPVSDHRRYDCVECSVPFALFNLCEAVAVTMGIHAAMEEYRHVLQQMAQEKVACWHLRQSFLVNLEHIAWYRCIGCGPLVSPREWRLAVLSAVEACPQDALFLRIFVDAESSRTVSQSLRKFFESRRRDWRRQLETPTLTDWLFALLCELSRAERSSVSCIETRSSERDACCLLHRWGLNRPAVERIRRVFEEMLAQRRTQGSAVAWRLYLRFEVAMGKIEAARRVLYRGIARCPWSKALYLDALRVLRPYLSAAECRELVELLSNKELHQRVDMDDEEE